MDIKKNFDTAFKDHQKGDLDNAVTLYKKILDMYPYHIPSLINLSLVFEQKKRFSNSEDLIIKKWPSKSTLNAWYVKLIQQGYQNSHIHPDGWISGVFYLKVPKFTNGQDGSIKLTLDGYDYPVDKKLPSLVHSPKDFDLILFPSSLFHGTIPFKSKETRHVIAFDLVPF